MENALLKGLISLFDVLYHLYCFVLVLCKTFCRMRNKTTISVALPKMGGIKQKKFNFFGCRFNRNGGNP